MNGAAHYREAERLAQRADEIGASGVRLDSGDPLLLLAQVHATLALAAATAYPAVRDWCGDEASETDSRAWAGATS